MYAGRATLYETKTPDLLLSQMAGAVSAPRLQVSYVLSVENRFKRLKDWRRVLICYDRYLQVFLAVIVLTATALIWISINDFETSAPKGF